MEKLELGRVGWQELSEREKWETKGGEGILYYLSYDVGYVLGTTLRVANQIAQSLFLDRATRPLK